MYDLIRKIFFQATFTAYIFSPDVAQSAYVKISCLFQENVSAEVQLDKEDGFHLKLGGDDTMSFEFIVEEGESVGLMSGNIGANDVLVINGEDKVSFVEITGSGTVNVTAVYGNSIGESWAVHSRSTSAFGWGQPSQWYGTCQIM